MGLNNLEKYIINQTLGAHSADNLPAALEARAIGIVKDSVTLPSKADVIAAINNEVSSGFSVVKGSVNPILVTIAEPIVVSIVDGLVGGVYDDAAKAWEAPVTNSTFSAAPAAQGDVVVPASPVAPASEEEPLTDANGQTAAQRAVANGITEDDALQQIKNEKLGG